MTSLAYERLDRETNDNNLEKRMSSTVMSCISKKQITTLNTQLAVLFLWEETKTTVNVQV